MSAENADRKCITNKFDNARLKSIEFATKQKFDVEGDPQSAPWLKKGVRKAKSGERVTAADLRKFDKFSGTI